jgi:hypothetical protein
MRYSLVTVISFPEYISCRVRPDGPEISKVLTVDILEPNLPFRGTIPATRAQRLWQAFIVEGYNAQKVPPLNSHHLVSDRSFHPTRYFGFNEKKCGKV